MTPELKDKYLKTIEKIEQTPRPAKWKLIKKLTLELKPWLVPAEADHAEACKEIRQKNDNQYASSQSGVMRNSMKLFGPVYMSIVKLDPEITVEMSGRNQDSQAKIGKQLWDAFPEYRICRTY
jgi:hypothetical protein